MTREEIDNFIKDNKEFINNCKSFLKELKEINHYKEFLVNQYKTNKRWFRDKPGKVTTEDIIKTCFEFGWTSRANYEHTKTK